MSEVLRESSAAGVVLLRIDRPERLNALNMAVRELLSAALHLERKAFQLLFATEDRTEGMRAFLEPRKPQFKRR